MTVCEWSQKEILQTILHEGRHLYADEPAFRFLRLFSSVGREGVGKSSDLNRTVNGKTKDSTDWRFAVRKLTEAVNSAVERVETLNDKVVKMALVYDRWAWPKADGLLKTYTLLMGMPREKAISRVISELATKFEVSESLMKERMVDLGFKDSRFVKVKDEGAITYNVRQEDIDFLNAHDQQFRKATEKWDFELIGSHYYLNSSRFIEERDGRLVPNEYAREHIEECCMGIHIQREERVPEGVLDENGRMERFNNDLVIRYLDRVAVQEEEYEVVFKAGITVEIMV